MLQGRIVFRIGEQELTEDVHDFALVAFEAIAEGDGVYINSSSRVAPARADASGTMHVAALAVTAIASGDLGPLRDRGPLPSTNYDFSGFVGQNAYISTGTAGQITEVVPSASGQIVQQVGTIRAPNLIQIDIGPGAQRDGGLF